MIQPQDSLKKVMLDRSNPQQPQQQPAESLSGDAMSRPGGLIGGLIGGGASMGGELLPTNPAGPLDSIHGSLGSRTSFPIDRENRFKTGLQPPTWPGTPGPAGPDIELLKQGNLPMPQMPAGKTPPRMERWETANKMIDGYQNGWNPNPIITRLMGGR